MTGQRKAGGGGDAVSLMLFGPPRVTRAGQPVTFDTRKSLALLARVALADRPVTRESLAALLWPGSDDDRARSSLRRTLSVTGAIGPALVVDRSAVALNPELVAVDVQEFLRLAGGDDPASWRTAVELAGDRFLDGFALRDAPDFDDWQSVTNTDLEQRLGRLLDRLVDRGIASGTLDQALRDARQRLDLDPLHEPAHQNVIRLLAWTGDRSGAMNQFRTCARILDRELGVRPLPETHALYDLVREDGLPAPARTEPALVAVVPAAPLEPAPIVGRDELLRRLRDERASTTTGRVLALVGEAGSGRTAVADAFAASTTGDGASVLSVRAHFAERSLALGAVTDLVRRMLAVAGTRSALSAADAAEVGRLVPDQDVASLPPLDSPGAQARLFDAVLRLVSAALGSGSSAGVLVVDDADQLDAASADFLGYLARRVPDRVLLLLVWRPQGEPASLEGATVERLTVPPLDDDAASALLAGLGVTVEGSELEALVRRTGGSPRLLREYALTAAVDDDVTSLEIQDLVTSRLDAAPETTRQVVAAAAVLGRASDPELLRATSGRADVEVVDALEDATARGLLVEIRGSGDYDVPYDPLRRLVIARLSEARRRLLHARAADALIARRGLGEVASSAEVAAQLAAAGRRDEAAEWHWRAAAEARALWAHTDALGHLADALALGHDPAATHLATGDALIALGRYADALVELELAASLSDEDADLATVEHRLADVHHRLGSWATSRAHAENAVALLEPCDDATSAVLRARARGDLALLHYREDDRDIALTVAEQALDEATSTGDAAALAQAHDVLGVLDAAAGHTERARTHLRAALAYAAPLNDPSTAVAALNNLARLEQQCGDLPAALDAAHRALKLGERHGDRHRLAALHTNLADLLHASGQPDDALAHLASAAALFAEVDRESERRPEIWKLVAW